MIETMSPLITLTYTGQMLAYKLMLHQGDGPTNRKEIKLEKRQSILFYTGRDSKRAS